MSGRIYWKIVWTVHRAEKPCVCFFGVAKYCLWCVSRRVRMRPFRAFMRCACNMVPYIVSCYEWLTVSQTHTANPDAAERSILCSDSVDFFVFLWILLILSGFCLCIVAVSTSFPVVLWGQPLLAKHFLWSTSTTRASVTVQPHRLLDVLPFPLWDRSARQRHGNQIEWVETTGSIACFRVNFV